MKSNYVDFEAQAPAAYGFERRVHPRTQVKIPVYLVTKDQKTNVRKLIRFETINMSRTGVMIESGNFPFKKSSFVDIVIMFPMGDNVQRIYYMDAFVQHTGNGKTGFSMSKKGPKA